MNVQQVRALFFKFQLAPLKLLKNKIIYVNISKMSIVKPNGAGTILVRPTAKKDKIKTIMKAILGLLIILWRKYIIVNKAGIVIA